MEYQLSNSFLKVTINSFGAEVQSVKDAVTGTEYIWSADPAVWKRHAPVLFPIVGRLKDDQYSYNGQTYHMGQHGFARDSEFSVEEQTEHKITFLLKSNATTKEMYPFDFEFRVIYELLNNMLQVGYQVNNKTDGEMIFGVGGHPGFNLPLGEGMKKENYYFSFEPSKSRINIPLVGAYIDKDNRTLGPTDTLIEVSDNLFKDDALIFELNTKSKISLRNDKNDYHINMVLDGTPFVGLWSPYPKTGDFVCIEPWWGIADEINADGNLSNKVGMNKLSANEEFKTHYQVTFHDKKND